MILQPLISALPKSKSGASRFLLHTLWMLILLTPPLLEIIYEFDALQILGLGIELNSYAS